MAHSFDTDVLDRAQAGDRVAFSALVKPHLDTLRRFAYSFCSDWVEADDLAQEALVKAYRSLPSFRRESSLSTWLYTVARSTFLDSRRSKVARQRSREDELDPMIQTEDDAADELLGRRHDVEQLWSKIRELDARFRVPLVLFDIEGMSYEHIASIERVPVGTVRSRLSRARAKLLELLGEDAGFESAPGASGTCAVGTPSHPSRRQAQ